MGARGFVATWGPPWAGTRIRRSVPAPRVRAAVAGDALQGDRLDVRDRLAVERAVAELDGQRVGVDARQHLGRGHLLTVRERRGGGDDPLVAVALPRAAAEAAVVLEHPRADLLADRVPADPLRAAADAELLDGGRELADQEILVLAPLVGDVRRLALGVRVRPLADQPLQFGQVLAMARRRERGVADAAQVPRAVALDVDDGVARPARR